VIPYVNIPPLKLGPLTFYAFGILVAIGLLLGARVAIEFGVKRRGLERDVMADLVAWIAIGGMLGGHILQVLFYRPAELLSQPWILFYVWSGLSSFGGFIGAIVAFLIWLHRRGIKNAMPYADSIAFGLVPGWIFGRMGCTVAHDHPGRHTDFFLAVRYPGGARFDLGFLELIFTVGILLPLFLFLRWRETVRGKPYPDGTYVGLMSLVYAPVRFGLDYLRATDLPTSDVRYFGLTPAQYAALGLFGLGIYLLGRRRGTSAPAAGVPAAGAQA
jgi:phosphatidylglycerol:prolipoprotein diacylglycerol transferase